MNKIQAVYTAVNIRLQLQPIKIDRPVQIYYWIYGIASPLWFTGQFNTEVYYYYYLLLRVEWDSHENEQTENEIFVSVGFLGTCLYEGRL